MTKYFTDRKTVRKYKTTKYWNDFFNRKTFIKNPESEYPD